jgi:ABC-2 type transport system permease protein
MINLLRAELFKLQKDRVFRTLLLMLVVAAIGYVLLTYYDDISGGTTTTGVEFLLEAIAGNTYIMKLGVSILAGFFIASEYSTGVMKTIASSGNSRGRLFAAKLVGFSIGGMMIALIFPALATLTGSLLSGFGQLPDGASASFIVRVFGLTLLYAVGFSIIAALFATLLPESGKVIGFSIIFFLMIDSLWAAIGSHIPLFMTMYKYSIFGMLGHIVDIRLEGGQMATIWLVPLLTIGLVGLLGYAAYRRKEIK